MNCQDPWLETKETTLVSRSRKGIYGKDTREFSESVGSGKGRRACSQNHSSGSVWSEADDLPQQHHRQPWAQDITPITSAVPPASLWMSLLLLPESILGTPHALLTADLTARGGGCPIGQRRPCVHSPAAWNEACLQL